MRFEWDDAKNDSNRKKHGISFETASLVFDDPNVLQFIERIEAGEERWHAIGFAMGTVFFLTVVYTFVDGNQATRIISARQATPRERRLYAEAIF